jgi:large subunit ribosomal protein L10
VNREKKLEVINSLEKSFASNDAAFIVNFQGMNVAQMEELRRAIRRDGGSVQVAKARLTKRAYQQVNAQGAQGLDLFKNQVGFVFAPTDSSKFAKTLHAFSQKNVALKVVGCMIGSHIYDHASFVKIASLPSREIILGQLCGILKAPMRNCVGVLNMILLRLLLVLRQVANNK